MPRLHLVLVDAHTHRLPSGRVRDGLVHCATGETHRTSGDGGARVVKGAHRYLWGR